MWQIQENIATYNGSFSMVLEVKLTHNGDGTVTTENEIVYIDEGVSKEQINKVMYSFGQTLQEVGLEKFNAYTQTKQV